MSILAFSSWNIPSDTVIASDTPRKDDWPLMSDVSTIRAGVPEALALWRRAEGKTPPLPSDPDCRERR